MGLYLPTCFEQLGDFSDLLGEVAGEKEGLAFPAGIAAVATQGQIRGRSQEQQILHYHIISPCVTVI